MATNLITTPPDIVGEAFKDYVNSQIKVRQKSHGSGYNDSNRSEKDLIYLNSRNSWVKMASSVVIGGDEGEKKLKDLGLSLKLIGDNLSKKSVLFNGITDSTNGVQKAGVASSNSTINNSAYGYGGATHGLNPMPGITSFVIGHNNIGSIRTATVQIKAHSPTQFGIINLLYIRLGFSMLIEWGSATYLDNKGRLKKMGPTIIDEDWFKGIGITALEFTEKTEAKRKTYYGNYDSFFGKVTNFKWSFNPDGSYDCSTDIIGMGDMMESLKVNIKLKTKSDNDQEPSSTVPEATTDPPLIANKTKTTLNKVLYGLFEQVNFGFGFKLLPTDIIAIRLEARDYLFDSAATGQDKTTHNMQGTLNVSVFF